jgi:CheY-like chemotaxis protein
MKQVSRQFGRHRHIVLVVDDNPAIRDMVSWALELDGYEPAEAAEGQEALAWIDNAAREGRYPSVILLDLAMPGMDGTLFLEQLRSQWESIHPLPAIVVITAASQTGKMIHADVKHVIVKPFHVRDLLDAVRMLTV